MYQREMEQDQQQDDDEHYNFCNKSPLQCLNEVCANRLWAPPNFEKQLIDKFGK